MQVVSDWQTLFGSHLLFRPFQEDCLYVLGSKAFAIHLQTNHVIASNTGELEFSAQSLAARHFYDFPKTTTQLYLLLDPRS